MTDYRRDPATGQLAQRLFTHASHTDGTPEPESERWIVVYFQPGSGLSVRSYAEDEIADWPDVLVVER